MTDPFASDGPAHPARDFDTDAAWLRRLSADAEGQLRALALRLREAMPELVEVEESRTLFGRPRITGVSLVFGERCYRLALLHGRLEASVALRSRGITLNTRPIPPAEWFGRIRDETEAAGDQARSLGRSLSAFMAG